MAFAAGSLLGAEFFHLLPESLEKINAGQAFTLTLADFILFIFLNLTSIDIDLNAMFILLRDPGKWGLHNFLRGLVLAATFL
ncbi:MAG: hypothetical protein QXS93_00700 [Candidatus Micrarchaeia archaeon]